MTANDNFRHYIGDLDATEDIDLVFKHIYDLMLANGGDGSGLNADMVDGYHSSDFAPASIAQELDNCIRRFYINGRKYEGQEFNIELFAEDVQIEKADELIPISDYLQSLSSIVTESATNINEMQQITEFLNSDENQQALSNILNNNIQTIIDDEENKQYYLDSDSVNGLSFRLVTQAQYDLLPKETKEDHRNVFIINNDLNTDFANSDYVPPSILKASMNLEFRINIATNNIEYSIDGGNRWAVLLPLVGTSSNKGILYPDWFSLIKTYMEDNSLLSIDNQDNYPFLLNTPDYNAKIEEAISSIKFGEGNNTTVVSENQDGEIDISDMLNSYLNNWVDSNRNYIQSKLTIPSINGLENTSNKSTNLSATQDNVHYPTTQAVATYVTNIKNTLQSSINTTNNKISESSWTNINPYNVLFKGGPIKMKKIGKIVHFTGSISTKTTVSYNGYDDYWNLFDIPSGFEPAYTERVAAQCSGTDRCFIYLDPNGYALIGRFDYLNKRAGTYTLPKDYWITFSGTYFTK